MKLIHRGSGEVLVIQDPPASGPAPGLPAKPQQLRKRLKRVEVRGETFRSHTNFKNGFIHELGEDQCRWPISNNSHLMCGAKSGGSKPYCEHHAKMARRA